MANAGTIVACPNCHTKNRVRAPTLALMICAIKSNPAPRLPAGYWPPVT